MRKISFFAALIICAVSALHASASLTNGSFEDYAGNLDGGYYQHIANGDSAAAATYVDGWGVGYGTLASQTNTGIDLVRILGGGANGSDQFVDLNGTPGPGNIFQSIATVANQAYTLAFYVTNSGSEGTFGVWVDDENGASLASGTAIATGTWVLHQVTFIAQSATTFIGFEQTVPPGGNTGLYLDDVSVNAVPEPATVLVWSVLGLTAAGVSYKRARKNTVVNS
jgi:hypothetical protein